MRSLFSRIFMAMLLLSFALTATQLIINYINQVIEFRSWHDTIAGEFYNKFSKQLESAGDILLTEDSFSLQELLEKSFQDERITSATIEAEDNSVIAHVADRHIPGDKDAPAAKLDDGSFNLDLIGLSRGESTFPVILDGTEIGTIKIVTLSPTLYSITKSYLNKTMLVFGLSLAVSLLLSFLLAYFLSRRIAGTPRKLARELTKLSEGERDVVFTSSNITELAAISDAARHLQQELVRNQKNRTEMMSNLGHDLRTPIAAMKVLVDGFLDGLFKPDTDIFRKIDSQLQELQQKSEAFQLIARLDSPTLSMHSSNCSILPLIQEIYSEFAEAAASREIDIRISMDPEISGIGFKCDENLMRIAFRSLVSNMVTYADSSSTAEIAIKEHEGAVVLEFTNCGSFGDSNPDSMFNYLAKGSKARNTKGAGLGLTSARNIIEKHGGSISIRNTVPGMVTVTVNLPAANVL